MPCVPTGCADSGVRDWRASASTSISLILECNDDLIDNDTRDYSPALFGGFSFVPYSLLTSS